MKSVLNIFIELSIYIIPHLNCHLHNEKKNSHSQKKWTKKIQIYCLIHKVLSFCKVPTLIIKIQVLGKYYTAYFCCPWSPLTRGRRKYLLRKTHLHSTSSEWRTLYPHILIGIYCHFFDDSYFDWSEIENKHSTTY